MRYNSPIQNKAHKEGREQAISEMRRILIRMAELRFGRASDLARAHLEGISTLKDLDHLGEMLIRVETWDEFLPAAGA